MHRGLFKVLSFLICSLLVLSACASAPTTEDVEQPQESVVEPAAETEVEGTEKDVTESESVEPAIEEDLIIVEIPTADGRVLEGRYFPAAKANAPLIVLMHWAPGDQDCMMEIAYWLQNRGLTGTSGLSTAGKPWLDPSWFPQIADERSYAVLTFTFYQCEGGCAAFNQEEWLIDAQSAMEFAYGLKGINPEKIITIGASIGADGAADGCAHLVSVNPTSCLGALSLSPGGYLLLEYEQVVADLSSTQPSIPSICFYAENDSESAAACGFDEEYEGHLSYMYSGSDHGMMLVRPDLDFDTLQIILDFLMDVLGE